MDDFSSIEPKLHHLDADGIALIRRAFEFAKEAHAGALRASGDPFFSHCLAVATTLADLKLDAPTVTAALLHDVVEDASVSEKQLASSFGEDVAFLVESVTKLKQLPYHGAERDVENLRKMFLAMARDIRVVVLKLADRMHNMRTLEHLPEEDRVRISKETLEIYAPLANRLGMGQVKGDLQDLAFRHLDPEGHRALLKKVSGIYEQKRDYAKRVEPAIAELLTKERIKFLDVQVRIKHLWSLHKKLERYGGDLEKIYDLVAMRLIVPSIEDCYAALGALHKHYHPLPGRIKDYIAVPKPNGYRSLHTTIFCEEGQITEFQIRTPDMHNEAEHGILAHWAWEEQGKEKKDAGGTSQLARKLTWVRQLHEWQQQKPGTQEFLESLRIDFFKDRIFVFTPHGDVIDLPEGATPVDFAYNIHSDIGDMCVGAKVNGKMTQLSDALANGDIVEILTQKDKKPSKDWLRFVKTSIARDHIRRATADKK